jgi:DNA (cytosine-5)-methyltransferase 1
MNLTSKDRPTVLDLFCGAGGLSLGFRDAGCRILGGIDINKYAIATHHHNFPDSPLKLPPLDITQLKPQDLSLKPGDVDILIGAPPCQVFSGVGVGKMKSLGKDIDLDPRNFLYEKFVEFIAYYQPFFFVLENVDKLRNKPIFNKIVNALELGKQGEQENYPGYRIRHQILTASDYGVPQVRKRLFVVGIRQDLDLQFEFPKPLTEKPVSVMEAIGDLISLTPPSLSVLKPKNSGSHRQDEFKPYLSLPQSKYQQKMRAKRYPSSIDSKIKQAPDDLDGVMNHICRSHNPVDLICFAMLAPGGKYTDLPESMRRYRWDIFDDKYKRLPLDKPAWTLTAHMQKDCLAYIHPTQTRSISVREAARLQSFPDRFVFCAPMTRMFELVGNSVPPLLAEAIAKPIVKQLKAYHKANPKVRQITLF